MDQETGLTLTLVMRRSRGGATAGTDAGCALPDVRDQPAADLPGILPVTWKSGEKDLLLIKEPEYDHDDQRENTDQRQVAVTRWFLHARGVVLQRLTEFPFRRCGGSG